MKRVAAVVLPLAVLAWLLALPIPAAHGADEVDFTRLAPVHLAAGDRFQQSVPAQGDGLSGIELPYRVTGGRTAGLDAELAAPDGQRLATLHLALGRPSPLAALFESPSQYGSDVETALLPVPAAGARGVVLTLTRRPGGGDLELYVSHGDRQRLPPLEATVGTTLALRTEYGGRAPAVTRAGFILERLGRWTPPWLPVGGLVVALAVLVAGGLALTVAGGRR